MGNSGWGSTAESMCGLSRVADWGNVGYLMLLLFAKMDIFLLRRIRLCAIVANTTFSDGCLGLDNVEGRSEV